MGCGTVLEESIVVSENQFQERAGGSGHTLVGQFVSMERQSHTLQGVPGLVSQESRELTYQKGRRLIEEIASQLRINQFCIDTSYNFFKMCVVKNLTRGRLRSHVVAACMYMTCRLENTAHLLLDFSDVTQVNVFDLGRTLSFLSRSLRINLPSTDPCLYIMRFACLLEFGDKQKEVVNLATRLVERMKRDWISTGRRPTGLCGAALLIASRAFNFNRAISDIVRVVHISESVVRKRLDEFSQTASGALTIDEFQTVDLDQNEDPPAYREACKKAREDMLKEEQRIAEQMTGDVHLMEAEVEKALEKKRREKFKTTAYAKMVTGVDEIGVGKAEAALVRDEIMESVYEAADNGLTQSTSQASNFGPTLQSLGIAPTQTITYKQEHLAPADNPNGDLDLDGIDDDEIDSYILSNAESEIKERFWMKMNGEHLKEMERRKREREEDEASNPDQKKKRRKPASAARHTDAGPAPSTAAEAIEKVIQEKKLSNKVNYDILKEIDHVSLFNPSQHVNEQAETPKPPAIDSGSLVKRESRTQRRNAVGSNPHRLNMVKEALSVPGIKREPADAEPTTSTEDVKPPTFHRNRFGRIRPNIAKSIKTELLPEASSADAVANGSNGCGGTEGEAAPGQETATSDNKKSSQILGNDSEGPLSATSSADTPSTSTADEKSSAPSTGRLIRGRKPAPVLKSKTETTNVEKPPTTSEKSEQNTTTPKPLSRRSLAKPMISATSLRKT